MKNLYRQFKTNFPLIACLLCFATFTFGQSEKPGVVRLKVNEALAAQLESRTFSRSASGEIVTGVASVDNINRQFRVTRFTRVFPYAGRHEAKHRKYGLHLWYEVRADEAVPVRQLIQSYKSDTQILAAEPVYEKAIVGSASKRFGPIVISGESDITVTLPDASNDPMLPRQWHYHNTGQTGGTQGADISLFDAWKIETGKSSVIVAVNDGGIQTDHPDLAANMWVNEGEIAGNNVDDDRNGYVDDVHGYSFVTEQGTITAEDHGTHVAGTIAAVNNNGVGVSGVAGGSGTGDGVRLMSCAVFHEELSADGFAEAYVYSADNGAVISQNSWGYSFPGVFEQVVLDAIDYFIAEAGKDENGNQVGPMNGGLVIFSSGNENAEGHYYPAYYEPVLAVASSTHKDTRAEYSNFGSWVDITAPGGETSRVEAEGVLSTLSGSQYGSFQGTSMACPHVSGTAALLLSYFAGNGLTPQALRNRLRYTADNIDALNPSYAGKLGTGRLNAARALLSEDNTAPSQIKDLAITHKQIGEMTLSWTSPHDQSGFTTAYELRYSRSPITSENFASATAVATPSPQPSGTRETVTVDRLPGGVRLYFAIRSKDFSGNVSPISNVASDVTLLAPAIALSAASLEAHLKTAEELTMTFSVLNKGKGPLTFTLEEEAGAFARATPVDGTIPPSGTRPITVSFSASRLPAGTYKKKIFIHHNDPLKEALTFPLTLVVTDNGAPIAALSVEDILFQATQVGASRVREVTISNEGSDPLVISNAKSGDPSFAVSPAEPITIQPFDEATFRVTYAPKASGMLSTDIAFTTNDPQRRTLLLHVSGEALTQAPVVVTPNRFQEVVDKGKRVTRQLTMENNGTRDVNFRIAATPPSTQSTAKDVASGRTADTTNPTLQARKHEERRAILRQKYPAESRVKAIRPSRNRIKNPGASARQTQTVTSTANSYITGFEEFATGGLGEQNGWFTTGGFSIETHNPDEGKQHLRGTSEVTGDGERFALSPSLFGPEDYDYPRYSSVSMRINLDKGHGNTWEIVPQDPWYVATRIRFNADGSIEAMVIDNDYIDHWKKVADTTPAGYFDLAIEYNSWGSDTSGFPTYLLFINNQHVFSGTGLASVIGQLAIVSKMETTGAVLDVDEVNLTPTEYIPEFISPSPAQGIIPAGESVNVGVAFDASALKFGTYSSDILVHLDEADSINIPALLTVTGESSMISEPTYIEMGSAAGDEAIGELFLTNTGGQPIEYDFDVTLAGLTVIPEKGTLALREQKHFTLRFTGEPGIYKTDLLLKTDFESTPRKIPVTITVMASGVVFFAPEQVTAMVAAGKISTKSFFIRNDGENEVSFMARTAYPYENILTVQPSSGIIGGQPQELILTIDARGLSAGTRTEWVEFATNDPNRPAASTLVRLEILPDTTGGGSIAQEVWTDIPGKNVGSIPLATLPDTTITLTLFESQPNFGDNYGSRIRGYVAPPLSGYYTFWIASNDNSELWLSTDSQEGNRKKIASVTGYTNAGQWEKYPSQRSAPVRLEAGQRYYIEALHKEGVGSDHLAVGWQLPDNALERPIPGMRLKRYDDTSSNAVPSVTILTPKPGDLFTAPASVLIEARAEDPDGTIAKVEFFADSRRLGTDIAEPFRLEWRDVAAGSYNLQVKVTDDTGLTNAASVDIVVAEGSQCAGAGQIIREQWNGIAGTLVSSIPVHAAADLTEQLLVFESPSDVGDRYGARIRGFVCVPTTGAYTFWIASNDKSELWLSTDERPANKVRIAYVSAYTNVRQWSKYPSQQSAPVELVAGRKYYIEALHKEGVGSDHLAVGWQLPDGTMERPMTGRYLMPFVHEGAPTVRITSPNAADAFDAPATVSIFAEAEDANGSISSVAFYSGETKLGTDDTPPYEFTWSDVAAGDYSLTAVATDNSGLTSTSRRVAIKVKQTACMAAGGITREYWTGVPGSDVADIPVNLPPQGKEDLPDFEGPANAGTHYGARIRGYICPPASGEYFFWIAGNDDTELWLSTDDDPANRRKIAFADNATGVREWDKFPTQKSGAIAMEKGQAYYIEALHKQGTGTDHVAVGWQLPGGTLERPIGGNRLSPFEPAPARQAGDEFNARSDSYHDMRLQVFPNPVKGNTLTINIATPGNLAESIELVVRQQTGLVEHRQTVPCNAEGCKTELPVDAYFPVPGLYFLQIMAGEQTITQKLVVP